MSNTFHIKMLVCEYVYKVHSDCPFQIVMINGSKALYDATNNRAFFKEVTILVPYWWNMSDAKPATIESFSTANFRIDEMNPAYNKIPYVKLGGDCGDPGAYAHLTYEYLLSNPRNVGRY